MLKLTKNKNKTSASSSNSNHLDVLPISSATEVGETITGAEAIVKSLLAEGVDLIFGYPGGAIMPTYDALWDFQSELQHILVRHEQGAAHAAQGYARSTGKVGVCIATSGPGATNLITGIADAQIDSTPLVCITGQVYKELLGTDAFQETDIIDISMPVTKWNYKVTKPEEIPKAIAKAFFIAKSGRPGPVLIDITKDAQVNSLQYKYKKFHGLNSYQPNPTPSHNRIRDAIRLLNRASKPLIVFGQGISLAHAEKEFDEFLTQTQIPAASTIMGLSAIPSDHPNYIGMLGMHGNYAPNLLTNECDVLLAVGMRFDDRVTGALEHYATQAKIIHIDIDPSEINKNVETDVAIIGDAKRVLPVLTKEVTAKSHSSWYARCKQLKKVEYNKVIHQELNSNSKDLNMSEVVELINSVTNQEAIIVTDVGQHQMAACRYAKFKNPKSMITSGGLGTMGFCVPACIGARLAQPHRTVIGIVGDGGVQMNIQEFGTIMQYQINVKIVILNNEFLGMVRQWQELYFEKKYASTEMQNPDFQKLAGAYGIEHSRVSKRSELFAQLKSMMEHDGPYLLEVMVAKEQNVFPMISPGDSVSDMRLEP